MTHCLYPKNPTPTLDASLFRNPSREYRGTPFWSWNTRIDVPQLLTQLDQLKAMGMGGATIHSRTGLETQYMGEEFMAAVRACVEHAREQEMLIWLYDEDRWPSGSAGGLVTKDLRYRAKHLRLTPTKKIPASGDAQNNSGLIGCWEVELSEEGRLIRYARVDEVCRPATGRIWYAYLETEVPRAWFNGQAYVDTLSPDAIRKFVEFTHDGYKAAVGSEFGKIVPAIFTDEPQFTFKQTFDLPTESRDIRIPWTDDLSSSFKTAYGFDLLDHLPEIFWELNDGNASVARYRYHDHVAERFAAAFADTCGQWCAANNIMLTGHMMEEPTLHSQTRALGETMRSYRSFQLPGIDMLCDVREFTTAKQAQSACRQYGRPGVLSELYGVTNWDFTFTGHKGQGDWQAALGVTVRVHHLNWVSMKGEAKRDYPAAIGYQSPWYRQYHFVEDHFARINVALTRGKPLVRVGVIHPVESFWLCYGPESQTAAEREERENSFADLTKWLLFGLIDFDFICESLLPSQGGTTVGTQLQVGEMAYDVILVPPMRTIRGTTLDRLEAFVAAGGKLLFTGETPTLVDAIASHRAAKLADRCARIPFARLRVLNALDSVRLLSIAHENGAPANSMLHQFRQDGSSRQLFICNTDRNSPRYRNTITLHGHWSITRLDTFTGETSAIFAELVGDSTQFNYDLEAAGHLLITLSPTESAPTTLSAKAEEKNWRELPRHAELVPITLAEPNVLMLDQAQWRLDGDADWQPIEEILRIDNLVRRRVGLPERSGDIVQPWADTAPAPVLATVGLRFQIDARVDIANPHLALEDAGITTIALDGVPVPSAADGYFVDESISTIKLPTIRAGTHLLDLSLPFTRNSGLEWCYLLGDFSVRVRGRSATIETAIRQIGFGNATHQGLAFYGGNFTYTLPLHLDKPAQVQIEIPRFAAPLITVAVDGKDVGPIAFPPYRLHLGRLSPGTHMIALTCFGNRINSFGAVHCYQPERTWWGPDSWRTDKENWGYEYNLRPTGILAAPRILMRD